MNKAITKTSKTVFVILLTSTLLTACFNNKNKDITPASGLSEAQNRINRIYTVANGCYSLKHENSYLASSSNSFSFSTTAVSEASAFLLRPTDLGVYLLYDTEQQYLTSNAMTISKSATLESESTNPFMDELDFITTNAEWRLEPTSNEDVFLLFNLKSAGWLGLNKLVTNKNEALALELTPNINCSSFPESEVGATYTALKTHHDDGALFGYADAHQHIMTNLSGSQNFLHGSPFHKLGIEHALPNCDKHHGTGGSKDIIGLSFSSPAGGSAITFDALLQEFVDHLFNGELLHDTSGFPDFTHWPAAFSLTHQQTYFKWIERAWLSGMRLMVDYTVSVEVLCNLSVALVPYQTGKRSCNEMEGVDRHFKRARHMERYIDAQNGGPGQGWYRLVYSPSEAREVISQGKLAVILGMEVENPFNCFRRAREGFPLCTEQDVQSRLDEYYDKGLRALFPVHKFSNGFGTGDGTTGILEIGDFLNTNGEWRDYVACNTINSEAIGNYEGNQSLFSDIFSYPADNLIFNFLTASGSALEIDPIFPLYPDSQELCQRDGLTDIGKYLMRAMMKKGMIIDVGHFSAADYIDGYKIFEENNYPPVDTHGGLYGGKLLALGGFVNSYFNDLCRNGDNRVANDFLNIVEATQAEPDNYQFAGIGYDFNGLSDYALPRYGTNTNCEQTQNEQERLQYPFTSFGGDVVFDQLKTGNRTFDFNNDGLANIGMFPEIIQEVRNGGVTDEQIDYLFKSAEGYLRVWERMYERRPFIK